MEDGVHLLDFGRFTRHIGGIQTLSYRQWIGFEINPPDDNVQHLLVCENESEGLHESHLIRYKLGCL